MGEVIPILRSVDAHERALCVLTRAEAIAMHHWCTKRSVGDAEDDDSALAQLCTALQKVRESLNTLYAEHEALRAAAETDSLSGLFNRGAFFARSRVLCTAAASTGRSVSCAMLDIDHFKRLNDEHGHQAGDRAIAAIARICRTAMRSTDLVCRYGGEEFAILLPDTSAPEAVAFAERIRTRIASEVHLSLGPLHPQAITASVGVADTEHGSPNIEALLARADRALYEAKHKGRNLVRLGA